MSWLKSAVTKAVEVGGTSLTRTVRDYAGTVVNTAGYAVIEGAKLLQGGRNFQSFRQTVKRLEEVSVSCRGIERVQLLRRWLVALKEIERISEYTAENNVASDGYSDEPKDFSRRPTLVYYYDPDLAEQPRNFRDVFLHSQALEGITLSVILEPPNEEEVVLLLELYRLCLNGESEVHNAVLSSIQDLAKAFSGYQEEVLVKREELLQYAQAAIAGLKLNADLSRIDAEALSLKESLDKMNSSQKFSSEDQKKASPEKAFATIEALEDARTQVQLCSTMELLLLRKKSLGGGDSPEAHREKVEKLKVLSESLGNSSSKAEKRIAENRYQKEEALSFRVAKTEETNQLEKEMSVEIKELEKQKAELEASLKKVNSSISAARARLHNAREEREQFDEASNQILVHLKSKEDELSRSILSCRVEADIVNTWINFLQDTWALETSCLEQNQKQISGDLEKYGDYFVNLVVQLLSSYKEGLCSSMSCMKRLIEEFESIPRLEAAFAKNDKRPRKTIEEEYLDLEAKVSTILSIVEIMRKQFYIQAEGIFRKDEQKVKELFDAIEKIKVETVSIERPDFQVETPPAPTAVHDGNGSSVFTILTEDYESLDSLKDGGIEDSPFQVERKAKIDSEQIKLELELEETDSELSPKEIGEWEYDDLDKELPPIVQNTGNKVELPASAVFTI